MLLTDKVMVLGYIELIDCTNLDNTSLRNDGNVGVEEGGVVELDGGDQLASVVAEDEERGAAEHEHADEQHWNKAKY